MQIHCWLKKNKYWNCSKDEGGLPVQRLNISNIVHAYLISIIFFFSPGTRNRETFDFYKLFSANLWQPCWSINFARTDRSTSLGISMIPFSCLRVSMTQGTRNFFTLVIRTPQTKNEALKSKPVQGKFQRKFEISFPLVIWFEF